MMANLNDEYFQDYLKAVTDQLMHKQQAMEQKLQQSMQVPQYIPPRDGTGAVDPDMDKANKIKVARKQVEVLEKILDDVYDVFTDTGGDYKKVGEFVVESYKIYIAEKAKNELMK